MSKNKLPTWGRMTHNLKCWPEYFGPLMEGFKTFEIRKNDRDYLLGDTLNLLEWIPESEQFTGRNVSFLVTYIMDSEELKPGFVVMGLSLVSPAVSVWSILTPLIDKAEADRAFPRSIAEDSHAEGRLYALRQALEALSDYHLTPRGPA